MAGLVRHFRITFPVLSQSPCQQPQPADSERKVVSAEKRHCGFARRAAQLRQLVEAETLQMPGQVCRDRIGAAEAIGWRSRLNLLCKCIDYPGVFDLGIAVISEPGLSNRLDIGLVPPCRQSLDGRVIHEQRPPEQFLDCFLDLGPQGIDDAAQPRHFARLCGQRVQIVANWLLARDRG